MSLPKNLAVGCAVEKARFEDGKLIFDIHWTNEGSDNIDIGPDFEVYKYNGSAPKKLEPLGYWNLNREMLAGKGMNTDDGFVFEYQCAKSYNISAHYDVLTPGKYRFEAHGSWVEFQIISDLFTTVYDTASFDVDGDGEATIIDATFIQRYNVKMEIPISEETLKKCGDVDGDGEVSVIDATFIQRFEAKIPTPYPIGEAIT